jgi:phenylalanyl-tRNA synthetase beta chain
MKVSFNWLKDLLDERAAAAPLSLEQAAEALTLLGFEVEGIDRRGTEIGGVLVAEVVAVRPHPGADKLRLVRVRAGNREEEVVCGAPNVPPPGHRVAWAPPGARLPGGKILEAREVRGVVSPGMLCSEPELGLASGKGDGDRGDGILVLSPSDPLATPGADLVGSFGVADAILELNVTPNRPDALSHLGVARELGAQFGLPLRVPTTTAPRTRATAASPLDVRIEDAGACARYQARFVEGVSVAPSPLTMRLRLAGCGIRPISNLVDVTNYVLLELGHPLHAFDRQRLQGAIQVRRARAGESLTTLDGVDRRLEEGDIVISDDRGPVALAGVMGGAESEVRADTRDLVLESAIFDPVSVRRTSKRLGLGSEASYRFERGVDAEGVPLAAARASALLADLGGGTSIDVVVDRYPTPVARRQVRLPLARLRRIAGLSLEVDEAARELAKVVTAVSVEDRGGAPVIAAEVPSYRPDLALPEDLVEEVLRLGQRYQAPARIERVLANARPAPSPEAPSDRARDVLAALGLSEVVTWGFVPRAALMAIAGGDPTLGEGLVVKNPISSDYEVMRTSLLPGMAAALGRNLARGLHDVRLFEVGPVVWRAAASPGEPLQREQAALLLAGRAGGWLKPGEPLDFFDLKRAVEGVLAAFGVAGEYQAGTGAAFLHPGVSATLSAGGTLLGQAGELHPEVRQRLGLSVPAFYAELDVAALVRAGRPVQPVVPPRFPAGTRDLSFWVAVETPAADQRAAFLSAGEPLLREVAVLEDFRDPRYAPAGQKGMLWTMVYRAEDRTLTDAEVDAAHAAVVAALGARLAIQIR